MALTVEFAVPAEDFETGRVFAAASRVELLDVVPVSECTPLFCAVDARNGDFTRVEDRLATAALPEQATVVERGESTRVYRLSGTTGDDALFRSIDDAGVAVDRAVGGDNWNIEGFASDRGSLRRLRQACTNRGVRVSVERIGSSMLDPENARDDLTDRQRRTLQRALEDGYFETPRQTTLSDLGDEFGITRQAVASRLRRGIKTLVTNSLVENPVGDLER
jgi:predicted DNA binding protein